MDYRRQSGAHGLMMCAHYAFSNAHMCRAHHRVWVLQLRVHLQTQDASWCCQHAPPPHSRYAPLCFFDLCCSHSFTHLHAHNHVHNHTRHSMQSKQQPSHPASMLTGTTHRSSPTPPANTQAVQAACAATMPPDHISLLPFDLLTTSDSDIQAAVRTAEGFFGAIDVVVHNAGMSQHSLAMHMPTSAFHTMLKLNLVAPLTLTHAVLPGMLARYVGV